MRTIVRVLLGGTLLVGITAVALVMLDGWGDDARADPSPPDTSGAPAPPALSAQPQILSVPAEPAPPPLPDLLPAPPVAAPRAPSEINVPDVVTRSESPPAIGLPAPVGVGTGPALPPAPEAPAVGPAGTTGTFGSLPSVPSLPSLPSPESALPPPLALADPQLADPQPPAGPIRGPGPVDAGALAVPRSAASPAPGLAPSGSASTFSGRAAHGSADIGGLLALFGGDGTPARAPPAEAPVHPCTGGGASGSSRGDPEGFLAASAGDATGRANVLADARAYSSTLLRDPLLRPD